MKILQGLMAGQVLQRDATGVGGAILRGHCAGGGTIDMRVLRGKRIVKGHGWQCVGTVQGERFEVALADLPSGGPYRVELRVVAEGAVVDHLSVDEVFVGDVWILGGQSNMEGVGNMSDALPPHPMVRAFYMRDAWAVAEGKIHFLAEAVDRVHNGYGDGPGRPRKVVLAQRRKVAQKGIGPGQAFGMAMYEITKVPQGLIACAHGGTSMQQWSPDLKDRGGDSLYGAMLRRYEKLGQKVTGIIWYQGESDANTGVQGRYCARMEALVRATRQDMGLPRLPWVVVQIGRHASAEDPGPWNAIQEQQRRLPETIARLDVVPSVDLDLDDGIHIRGADQHRLGRRLARAAARLAHGGKGTKPGIVLDAIDLVPTPDNVPGDGSPAVRVRYRNVTGLLQSPGLPAGFSLVDARGQDTRSIYRTTLERHAVVLHTTQNRIQLEELSVCYGAGRLPYCNITDAVDMGLPVMLAQPVSVDHPRACTQWQTARLPQVQSVGRMRHADIATAKDWETAVPRAGFGVLPQPPSSTDSGVFVLRATLETPVVLRAALQFGANAPFVVWLNGKRVLRDLACGIPLQPDQYAVVLRLAAGTNCLEVGFQVEHPAPHFGISARFGTPEGKQEPRLCFG